MLRPPALSSTAGCEVDDTAGVRGLGGQPEFKGQLPFLFGKTNEHESEVLSNNNSSLAHLLQLVQGSEESVFG